MKSPYKKVQRIGNLTYKASAENRLKDFDLLRFKKVQNRVLKNYNFKKRADFETLC